MNFLKGAIIFLLGSGVGATGSYIYFKKKYDEKKEELDELKEHYQEKLNIKSDLKTVDSIIKKEKYVPYDVVTKTIKEREVVTDLIARPTEDYPEEPIVITDTDYTEHELYFDKIETDYYVEDGALVGENEELLEVNDTIGYENLESFIKNESEDVMYIRNAPRSSDYLVRKIFGKYSDVIGAGGGDDDE